MAWMEQIVSLVRDYLHAEAGAGYPLLRQIPSTRATACLDYLDSIPPAERGNYWTRALGLPRWALCLRRLRSRRFSN